MMITVFGQEIEIPDDLWEKYRKVCGEDAEKNIKEILIPGCEDPQGEMEYFIVRENRRQYAELTDTRADRKKPILQDVVNGMVSCTVFQKNISLPFTDVENYEKSMGFPVNLIQLEGFILSENIPLCDYLSMGEKEVSALILHVMQEEMEAKESFLNIVGGVFQ